MPAEQKIVIDVRPGEKIRFAFAVGQQTVEWAQRYAREIRAAGAVVVGCSLDDRVKRGETCPVCGMPGLA